MTILSLSLFIGGLIFAVVTWCVKQIPSAVFILGSILAVIGGWLLHWVVGVVTLIVMPVSLLLLNTWRNRLANAIIAGDAEAVERLLSTGARVDAEVRGATPLQAASFYNQIDLAELLVLRGANVNAVCRSEGRTPLAIAAIKGYTNIAQLLIDKGATVNPMGGDGTLTPLMSAAGKGHADIVELLIANGGDVNANTITTPLHYAADGGYTGIAELLIGKGANVNAVDPAGFTPLSVARESGQTDMVHLLLEHGGR